MANTGNLRDEFNKVHEMLKAYVAKLKANLEKENKLAEFKSLVAALDELVFDKLTKEPVLESVVVDLPDITESNLPIKFKLDVALELQNLFTFEDSKISDWHRKYKHQNYGKEYYKQHELAPNLVAGGLVLGSVLTPAILAGCGLLAATGYGLVAMPFVILAVLTISAYIKAHNYEKKADITKQKVLANNLKADISESTGKLKAALKDSPRDTCSQFFKAAHQAHQQLAQDRHHQQPGTSPVNQ